MKVRGQQVYSAAERITRLSTPDDQTGCWNWNNANELSDEQIEAIFALPETGEHKTWVIDFARAILAADRSLRSQNHDVHQAGALPSAPEAVDERQAFEAFFATTNVKGRRKLETMFERSLCESWAYADDSTQRHWWTWQNATRAAIESTEKP